MDIFETMVKPDEEYLFVLLNGEIMKLGYYDLFSNESYDTMYAVTYVSSPSFFSKISRGYEKVEIILGIDNPDVNHAFSSSIIEKMLARGADFFKGLDDNSKDKLIENKISIRYANLGILIHSKIYLLSNSKTGLKRVVIGSANLTESAFNRNIKQYEDLLVFDDEYYYELFKSRYNAIKKDTVDFIPERVKEKYMLEKAYYIDDEERVEVIVDELTRHGGTIIIPDEIVDSINIMANNNEEKNIEYQVVTKIINQSSKKKGKDLVIKPATEIFKSKAIIKELILQKSKRAKDINRFSLYYNDYEQRIDYEKTFEDGSKKSINYGIRTSKEDIEKSLIRIHKFIEAYRKFTSNPDEDNLSKVYEVILYSFMSVFLFEIREEYGLEIGKAEKREDIPVFLIIGGRAKSGKSSLLSFISKLTSNYIGKDYLEYKDIEKAGVLEALFYENNIYPILVDEMSEKFFNSTAQSKGEIFIKHIANSRDGHHPALITTTNTSNFNVPGQVLRRVYYIQIDKTFDDNNKIESDAYFIDTISGVDNVLFRDFCARVCELIRDGQKIYKDSSDPLWLARKIFKEYYDELGLDIPLYFPEGPFDDYKNRGKNMWTTLFNEKREIFRYNQDSDTLIVTLSNFMDEKEKKNYLNYIDVGCIKEDMGLYTVLHSTMFFNWIGNSNPFIKKQRFRLRFLKHTNK